VTPAHPTNPTAKLPFSRMLGYGIGDFGFNLFYTGLNLYLLYYYTDVLGIAPATAGLIFMIPVVWDALIDPVIGSVASRTRTRWGAYRPYVLLGAPTMAFSFVTMFAAPVIFPGAVVAASLASHMLFRTCYAVVSIPYTALSAVMTQDGAERSVIAGTRMVFAVGGGVFAAFLTPRLAEYLGEGDLRRWYILVSLLFAAIATVLMVVVFGSTRGPTGFTAGGHGHGETLSLARSAQFLRRNSAFWIVFAAVFGAALGSSVSSKALVYYITYVVREPSAVSGALAASLLVTGASIPVWAWAGTRFSKRDVWLAGSVGLAFSHATLLLVAPRELPLLIGLYCLAAVFGGAFITMFWAMLPDTVEYGEWRSGIRDEGIVFGLSQLALKASSGIGVGLLGVALGMIGYRANVLQPDEVLDGLKWLSFGVPLVATLAVMLIIRLSPITKRRHTVIVKILAKRR